MRLNQVRVLAGVLLASVAGLALVLPSRTSSAYWEQPDWSKITIKVHKLGDNVYMLEGVGGFSGGNIGLLVGDDGALMVDSSFPPLAPKLEKEIAKLSKKPLRFILNTHFHGDHTSGNVELGGKATVVAHDNVRLRLQRDGFRPDEPAPPVALPIITFDQGITFHLDGEDVSAVHLGPAHTDSDLVVTFKKAKVVHMGDLFFNGMYPFIDLDNGGSVKGYVASVAKVLADLPPDVKIIPGHGPPAGRKELEAYLAMLNEAVALVEKGIAEKKSAGSLKHAQIFAKFEPLYGKNSFITANELIDSFYRDLSPKTK